MLTTEADLIRRFYAAWTERDLPSMLELVDPDVAVEPILGVLYARESYHGRDDLAAWYAEITGRWERFEAEVEKVRRRRDGTTVAFVRLCGHRGEEVFEARIAVECFFRDGRISAFRGRDVWEAQEELDIGV